MIAPVTRHCPYCHRIHAMSDARGPHNCPTPEEELLNTRLALDIPIPEELKTRGKSKRPGRIK